MVSRNRRSLAAYYDTASSAWIDFRHTPFVGGSYDYYNSSTDSDDTHPSALVGFTLRDEIGTPEQALLRIRNRPARPMLGNPALAGAQGPFSGKISEFTKIRVKDTQTNQVYFYGVVYDVIDTIETQGGFLALKCYDMLQEIKDSSTVGSPDYIISGKHNNFHSSYTKTSTKTDANGPMWGSLDTELKSAINDSVTTIPIKENKGYQVGQIIQITNSSNQSEQMTITGYNNDADAPTLDVARKTPGSFNANYDADDPAAAYAFTEGNSVTCVSNPSARSGLIKSLVSHNSTNLSVPTNASASTDARFQDSVVRINPPDESPETAKFSKSSRYSIDSDQSESILSIIQHLGAQDPHNSTLTDERTFGYDYYVSPNFLDAAATNEVPKAAFNYFKRGTFPTITPTFNDSSSTTPSAGTFDEGLSIYYPDKARHSSTGKFAETGRLIPMTSSDFSRPKDEIYTAANVEFDEVVDDETYTVKTQMVYVEAATIVNNDASYPHADLNRGFIFNQLPSDGIVSSLLIEGAKIAKGFWSAAKDILMDTSFVDDDDTVDGFLQHESAEYLNVKLSQLNGGINDSVTDITVDSNATTAGFYVGQYIQVDDGSNSEVMRINKIEDSTSLLVQRDALGKGVYSHDDNASVLAYHVAKIQYVGKEAALSSGNYQNITSTGVLLSHIDSRLIDGDEDENFDEYWKVGGSSKTWVGDVSGTTMTLSYTPQNSYDYHRVATLTSVSGMTDPGTIRETIFSALQRGSTETIRASVSTFRPPRYYFDNEVDTDSVAQTQILTLDSANPLTEGVKIGTTVNQLSSGAPSGIYGYVTAVTSTTASVKWSSGSGLGDGVTVRFYVDVRAGHLVKVKNDTANIDTIFIINKIDFSEENGVQLTKYNIVACPDEKRGIGLKNFGAPPSWNPIGGTGIAPRLETVKMRFKIRSVGTQTVRWSGGTITYRGNTYTISGGQSGTLTSGNTYILYMSVGNPILKIAEETVFNTTIRYYYHKEIVRLADIITDKNSTHGEFAKVMLYSNITGRDAIHQVPASEIIAGGELQLTTPTNVDLEGNLNEDLDAVENEMTVTDDGSTVPGEKAFWIGQEVLIEDEIMKIVSKNSGWNDSVASTKYFNVKRNNGVPHLTADGTTIRGNFRAGKIKPLEFDTGNYGLSFYTPAISSSNIFSYEQTLSIGKAIGTSFVNGGSLGAKADIQILDGHLEMKSSTTANYSIAWVDSGALSGSISMNGSYLFLEEATVADNFVGITAVHDHDTYIRWNDSDNLEFWSGSHKAFYTRATSAANGAIFVEGFYTWVDDPDTYITAASDKMSFYSGGYESFYTIASSAADGAIYVGGKYSWLGDTDTYITRSTNQIELHTAGSLGMRVDSSQNVRIEGTDADLVVKRFYSWVDDTNTYIYGNSDIITFTTNGSAKWSIGSGGDLLPSTDGSGGAGFDIGSASYEVDKFYGYTIYFSNSASTTGTDLIVTASGQIAKKSSSIQYKDNVKELVFDSSKLDVLRPVSYDYKLDDAPDIGLIAEEVDEVLPELINYDKEGNPESVKYHSLAVMLLDEVKKLRKEVKNLKEDK